MQAPAEMRAIRAKKILMSAEDEVRKASAQFCAAERMLNGDAGLSALSLLAQPLRHSYSLTRFIDPTNTAERCGYSGTI
jgi:hypothetical protein